MHLSEYFFKKRTLFWTLFAVILVGGAYAYLKMPKLEDPTMAPKQADIVTPYPGATAHEVELEVTGLLEDELRTMRDVDNITSVSSPGISRITVYLKRTVPDKELDQRWDILRKKVAGVRLPSGAMAPIVIDDAADIYGLFYAITADGEEPAAVEKYAKYLRRELLPVEGVKRIALFGVREENIEVAVPKEEIARNGYYPMMIMSALNGQNAPVAAGHYYVGGEKIPIDVSGKISSPEDVADLSIPTTAGSTVKLGEIASVSRCYAEPQTRGFWVDGRPAIALGIAANPDEVITDFGKRIEAKMEVLKATLPAGYRCEKVYFQPELVDDAVNSFLLNLLESIGIVILVLALFMGWRSGLIIGTGLVLTVLASFPVLLVLGSTLQRISLGAFIVAMGMLVDNAVVVMDGILVDRSRGVAWGEALFRTAKLTAVPLLGATVIAVVTLLPVAITPDDVGVYVADLFYVLCVSLLISWILAMVQVPIFSRFMLPKPAGGDVVKKDGGIPMDGWVRKSVNLFLKHRITTLIVSVLCLGLAVLGFFGVKQIFFPDFNYNQLYVEYSLPAQTSPDKVKQDLLRMTRDLQDYPQIRRISASQGQTPLRYSMARAVTAGGDAYGELLLDFKDYKTARKMRSVIENRLRSDYADARIRVRKYNFTITSTHTIEVEFSGPDPMVLRDLSSKAQAVMRESPHVDINTVCDNWEAKSKVMTAVYDRNLGGCLGKSRNDVGQALQAATEGLPVGMVYDGDKSLLVRLKLRHADGSEILDLNDIPVWSLAPRVNPDEVDIMGMAQGYVSLDDVTANATKASSLHQVTDELGLEWNEVGIYRVNGKRAIEAQCDPLEGIPTNRALRDVKKRIEQIPLPEGYGRRWLGNEKISDEAIFNVVKLYPIALFLIVVILLLLFNSMRKVLLVLACLPFAFIGIVLGLLLTGTPFTFMCIIGLFGLVGMMVKNEIVLIDEIGRLTRDGLMPYDAIKQAVVNRTRPVMMASITTILGMLPLVADPMYGSMAVTIMAGLAMGTITTLILLPIFYALLFRIKTPETEA